ncbi:hypothetical protein KM043_018215 [Ampulex compressa]|nr:hypothetical protein KM043_018215 [Ampulex compressa]
MGLCSSPHADPGEKKARGKGWRTKGIMESEMSIEEHAIRSYNPQPRSSRDGNSATAEQKTDLDLGSLDVKSISPLAKFNKGPVRGRKLDKCGTINESKPT